MYGRTYGKSKDQPGKVANPARGQLNRENEYFPVPVRALRIYSCAPFITCTFVDIENELLGLDLSSPVRCSVKFCEGEAAPFYIQS